VGKAGRSFGDPPEAQGLVLAVGPNEDHGRVVAIDMPIDALVRDVHALGVAIEKRPQAGAAAARLRIRIGSELRQFRHRCLSFALDGETLRVCVLIVNSVYELSIDNYENDFSRSA
jgi:hypothetical protein